ncbi:MAG: hypothetical protein NT167_31600, partial [Verrucomicrobia bacterium]|nr:hypothetical protein [Verrucomicrobiota bacterium]
LAFVGVQCSEPFDRLEIRETSGGCDNEFFGEFYSGGPPALAIRRFMDSLIEASWPTNASGFELEATSVLPATSWNVVTNAVQAYDDRFAVTIDPAESRRYFRLRR